MTTEGGIFSVHVLSDSSGETASHVVQAAIAQFDPGALKIKRCPRLRCASDVEAALAAIRNESEQAGAHCLVVYTIVGPELRRAMDLGLLREGLDGLDLLNPLITKIATLSDKTPFSRPGRSHILDAAYFRRMEAVNFSVHFDDGQFPEGIRQADVVLTGLSRTSKTPTCMYLAQQYGLRAANVPLVKGINPPSSLFEIPPSRVFGLTIEPDFLYPLRQTRAASLGLSGSCSYAEPDEIRAEVRYAHSVFRLIGCTVIDVSTRAIEETASEIYLYLEREGRRTAPTPQRRHDNETEEVHDRR